MWTELSLIIGAASFMHNKVNYFSWDVFFQFIDDKRSAWIIGDSQIGWLWMYTEMDRIISFSGQSSNKLIIFINNCEYSIVFILNNVD